MMNVKIKKRKSLKISARRFFGSFYLGIFSLSMVAQPLIFGAEAAAGDLLITCDNVAVNGNVWTFSGTWHAYDFAGQSSQYDAAIFSPSQVLIDGSSKDSPDTFTITQGPSKFTGQANKDDMSGNWTNEVVFTSAPSAVVAALHHANVSGAEISGDAVCSFTLPPTPTASPNPSPSSSVQPSPSVFPSPSISPSPVVTPGTGTITIVQDTIPDSPQDFIFSTIGGLLPAIFTLDDDLDSIFSNIMTFLNVPTGTYTIAQTPVAGFDTLSIFCSDVVASNGSAIDLQLEDNETISCTFENEQTSAIPASPSPSVVPSPSVEPSPSVGPDPVLPGSSPSPSPTPEPATASLSVTGGSGGGCYGCEPYNPATTSPTPSPDLSVTAPEVLGATTASSIDESAAQILGDTLPETGLSLNDRMLVSAFFALVMTGLMMIVAGYGLLPIKLK